MNKMQQQVREFMTEKNQETRAFGEEPTVECKLLRFRLIHEEAGEVCTAIMKGETHEIVDGICDLLYVVFGTAEAYGIDIEPFFDEVHRTNMLKDLHTKDEFGKVVKPAGWEPPRIFEMLEEYARGGNWMDRVALSKAEVVELKAKNGIIASDEPKTLAEIERAAEAELERMAEIGKA